MSGKYKIYDESKAHFITSTVVDWIELFKIEGCPQIIIDSMQFCVKNKGLEIYAWCLMPNHLHMICRAAKKLRLSDILRDFKTHTSRTLIKQLKNSFDRDSQNILEQFSKACSHLKRNQKYKVWQDGNQPKEIHSSGFLYQKLEYIHNNPVKAGIVDKPWNYPFSSAKDYVGGKGLVDVVLVDHKPMTLTWKI